MRIELEHNKTISKICDTLSRLLIQGSQHQMQLHRKKKGFYGCAMEQHFRGEKLEKNSTLTYDKDY